MTKRRIASWVWGVSLTVLGSGAACAADAVDGRSPNGALPALESVAVRVAGAGQQLSFDATVEAIRQTVVAAQVPGAVVAIEVKTGDAVRAGQLLARIDARGAEQTAAASDAQVKAIRAALEVAGKELDRQRQLFAQAYISRASLERAEATHQAAQAQFDAQRAQAGAARTQTGLHQVRAPYAGIVADVPVALGDMAMPGRPLLTLYDPGALRVTAAVPQTVAGRPILPGAIRVELPGLDLDRRWVVPSRVTVLPTVDAATHTTQLRLDLPAGTPVASPGMFARVWLAAPAEPGGAGQRLYVPASAVLRRAEMTGVYVIDPQGRPALRQVRLGPVLERDIEILSGVAAGERIALDPQAAARRR